MKTAFINASIYTVNPDQPWAEALLVEDGKISAVGSEGEVRDAAPEGTDFVDLDGRMVMPGIHDAHLHLLFSGLKFRFEPRLSPGAAPQQIIEDLKTCHCHGPKDAAGNEWIIGGEFFPPAFGDEGVDRRFLDEAFPEQPVFLYDYSIHHGLANSRALELAGISDSVDDPRGGRFIRREGTGELTGELVEQARWPVMRAMPGHPDQTNAEAVAWAVSMCHKYGITSVQEASANPPALRAFRTLDGDGGLKLHIAAHLVWKEEGFGGASAAELDRLIEARDAWRSAHVDTGFIKIWLDGAPLPPHMTEAGLTADNAVEESKILIPSDELARALVKFDAEGLTVKIHCAGEGAIRTALDAIAYVREHNGPDGPSHEVAHAGFISDQDYGRLPELNVTAEMSPALWHIPEYGLQDGFRFNSVLKHGAAMTVGSDWIITESPNLFPGLQGMLQHGEESVDLATAIQSVTIAGARAVNREQSQGSIEVGKSADFIVLDRNLFDVPVDDIGTTAVLRTVFEGETVYAAD
ncbi:amidohydrolase [Arthrobacter mobilis]|uniref:Amidohydrolase n=1 Tax=Arthrobacter mobilis TaxID=2724944 RepID=A0A7X6H9U4_9MICC|nr:amidohydrolase [Arthrobacter mobilis]NKX53128.1 amidohydrolase [Arthrobacter mobilis]